MGEFRFHQDDEGIVTVTMDMDGPVNTMSEAFWPLYSGTIARLEATEGLTGVIWTSAKDTFFAGGDLNMLRSIGPDEVGRMFAAVEEIKALMRRHERLGVPTVAALGGAALGGGLELALTCTRRIAADTPRTKIGLPEVTLGLLPGGGGVVRLTWLLGLEAAMPFLLEGRQVGPEEAARAGIVHEVVPAAQLLSRAKEWILSVRGDAAAATQPWDAKGYRIPGGRSTSPANMTRIAGAAAMLYRRTRGLLPAPVHILDTMAEAAGKVDFDTATRYESRRFVSLLPRAETKNMISTLFFDMNKVKGGASRPKDVPPTQVRRLGILGAGMMGHGIAHAAAMAGIEVVLKDISPDAARRGRDQVAALLDRRVEKGRMMPEARDAVLARITPTDRAKDLRGCDLIIEAVPERIEVKDAVLREHEELLAKDGIWGSNTSTLPITRLAQKARRPENLIGLHFFSPVDRMPLLEIVLGEKTGNQTLARAFDFARQIGKTPIVVNDGTGFYTSRTIGTKMIEAVQLVAEGHDPVRVDNLTRALGMPTGMLALLDEVQISLVNEIHDTQVGMGLLDPASEPNPEARALLAEMVERHGRTGKAAGKGFYDYGPEGRTIWPGLSKWRNPQTRISDDDIKDRILFRPVLESLRCLEEGVLRSVAEGNVGSILGIGAPLWTGGYIQFVNTFGLRRSLNRCNELASKYGNRFAPPEILKRHAADNRPFT